MNNLLLSRGQSSLRHGFRTLCNSYTIRSASLNSAIGRVLRRSKGVGFRGKEKDKTEFYERNSGRLSKDVGFSGREKDKPEFQERHSGFKDRNSGGLRDRERGGWRSSQNEHYSPGKRDTVRTTDTKLFRGKKFDSDEDSRPSRLSRRARFNDPDKGFGKGSRYKPTSDRPASQGFESTGGRRRLVLSEKAQRAAESDRMALQRNPDGRRLSESRKVFLERTDRLRERQNIDNDEALPSRGSRSERQGSSHSESKGRDSYAGTGVGDWRSRVIEDYKKEERKMFPEDKRSSRTEFSKENGSSGYNGQKTENGFARTGDKFSSARDSKDWERTNDNRSPLTGGFDKRMPLSIPYTTPASEFLYGTSVVETALTSRKEPRRKLYKLYIHRGENGENEARDMSIERLARNAGVEVHNVNSGWLRLMDKMSGGRPHNGYILEASPLPKLPILSLGSIASDTGKHGFSVVLDYQSREEAAINGTSSFISIPRDLSGRKPFVLLLDSIQDPGNLGGIIRTASFLGVTAVAISTRNSASFTPVVLKASAGASEQVTLFSIKSPAGFLENSKTAGWKIYAAVAPAPFRKPNDPPSLTTDELEDPLIKDPCILMLGNEGEGLRWNLRSKAHYDLSIPGSEQSGGVNSLNVSVAAGILCNSFIRNRHASPLTSGKQAEGKQLETFLRPKRDLF